VPTFSEDGFKKRLVNFFADTSQVNLFTATSLCIKQALKQSVHMIENPRFRDLLVYTSHGTLRDEQIPKRTQHRENIMKQFRAHQASVVARIKGVRDDQRTMSRSNRISRHLVGFHQRGISGLSVTSKVTALGAPISLSAIHALASLP
jgi:hypothetical protein